MKATTISFISDKGGVGKTTTAVNLAGGLAVLGKKVLIVDVNPQQNIAQFFGYEQDGKATFSQIVQSAASEVPLISENTVKETIRHSDCGIDYIPSSKKTLLKLPMLCDGDINVVKKAMLSSAFEDYDYIIFDCKDSLEEYLTPECLVASDTAIIVTECGQYSIYSLFPVYNAIDSIKSRYNPTLSVCGVLINKKGVGSVADSVANQTAQAFAEDVFETIIPFRQAQIENSIAEHKPCSHLKNNTLKDVYYSLATEVIGRTAK